MQNRTKPVFNKCNKRKSNAMKCACISKQKLKLRKVLVLTKLKGYKITAVCHHGPLSKRAFYTSSEAMENSGRGFFPGK